MRAPDLLAQGRPALPSRKRMQLAGSLGTLLLIISPYFAG
jgi:hypothetical protein